MTDASQGIDQRWKDSQGSAADQTAFLSLESRIRRKYLDEGASHPLMETLETEVLPRLMLAHESERRLAALHVHRDIQIDPDYVCSFVDALIGPSPQSANDIIYAFLSDGVAAEAIFLDLLAPGARELGRRWDDDEIGFTDVTLGLCELHHLLREHATYAPGKRPATRAVPASVLLLPARGDQHMFGLMIVAEFFRSDGWNVVIEPDTNWATAKRQLATTHFDVVGLSVMRKTDEDVLREDIATLRRVSKNGDIAVLLGGVGLRADPDLASSLGADAITGDAVDAVSVGNSLLAKGS